MFNPHAHIYHGTEDQVIVRIHPDRSAILTMAEAISLKNDLINVIKQSAALTNAMHSDGKSSGVCETCGYDHPGINCSDFQ